jgi:CYTH domain-containing protein
MPIENERKFVLDERSLQEASLAGMPGVTRRLLRQAYLDAPGLRIRAIEAPDETRYVFGYKRMVDDQMVEIETDISKADFDRLWKLRKESLEKVRYAWEDGRFHWDTDFFKCADGQTYFAMAEVEMPEEQREPPPVPGCLSPYLWGLVRLGDPRFTSKRLANQDHAKGLAASIRATGALY